MPGAERIIPVPRRGGTGSGGPGATTFLDLTDTPSSYAGFSGFAIIVNPGETGLTYSAVPFVSPAEDVITVSGVVIGQPVYSFNALGEVELAKADAAITSRVLGMSIFDRAAALMTSIINSGYIEQPDWTAVIGTMFLTFGTQYFLSNVTAGMMITTAPTTSGHYVVPLGVAVSPTKFSVNVGLPTRRA